MYDPQDRSSVAEGAYNGPGIKIDPCQKAADFE